LDIIRLHRPVKRGRSVPFSRVYVDTATDQRLDSGSVPLFDCLEQPKVACGPE